jgi:hypothetical protein
MTKFGDVSTAADYVAEAVVDTAAPSSPSAGELWFDTDEATTALGSAALNNTTDFVLAASLPAPPPNVQVFTTPGSATWTKPTAPTGCMAYTLVEGVLIGGGGAGASGRKGAAGSVRGGGAGGAPGMVTRFVLPIAAFGATETIVVGRGGVGGASVTTSDTNGVDGEFHIDVDSIVGAGSLGIRAGGGGDVSTGQSRGGTTAGGTKGWPGHGSSGYAEGGAGGTGAGGTGASVNGGFTVEGSSGAGGGAGVSAGNAAAAGGMAGVLGNATRVAMDGQVNGIGTGTPGGTVGASPNGTDGISRATGDITTGTSGGGGASSTTGDAGRGGDGGLYGGAGGGGGAAVNAVGNSGRGGNGAQGVVMMICR